MTLEVGSRLAHYEILEPVGAGGMAEVYRARVTKLGRDVAIKVLPDDFAQVRERLERFEREAKLLAALNHPNAVRWRLCREIRCLSQRRLRDDHPGRRRSA